MRILLACCFIAAPMAKGLTLTDAKITMLMMDKSYPNKVYVATDKEHAISGSSCHSSTWSYVLTLSTPFDDKLFSLLMAAKMADSSVNLLGSGACDSHAGIQDLRRVEVKD